MVNSPLIKPCFLGGMALGGAPLDSHDFDDMGTRRFFKLGAKGKLFFMLTTVLSAPGHPFIKSRIHSCGPKVLDIEV